MPVIQSGASAKDLARIKELEEKVRDLTLHLDKVDKNVKAMDLNKLEKKIEEVEKLAKSKPTHDHLTQIKTDLEHTMHKEFDKIKPQIDKALKQQMQIDDN